MNLVLQLNTLLEVRDRSEALIDPLELEDLGLQGMADASPPKWHLAHTNWFFETLVTSTDRAAIVSMLIPLRVSIAAAIQSWR